MIDYSHIITVKIDFIKMYLFFQAVAVDIFAPGTCIIEFLGRRDLMELLLAVTFRTLRSAEFPV